MTTYLIFIIAYLWITGGWFSYQACVAHGAVQPGKTSAVICLTLWPLIVTAAIFAGPKEVKGNAGR